MHGWMDVKIEMNPETGSESKRLLLQPLLLFCKLNYAHRHLHPLSHSYIWAKRTPVSPPFHTASQPAAMGLQRLNSLTYSCTHATNLHTSFIPASRPLITSCPSDPPLPTPKRIMRPTPREPSEPPHSPLLFPSQPPGQTTRSRAVAAQGG